MPIAAHSERRRPDRPAEVEGEDLRARIAPELQAISASSTFTRARRSNDEGVADIADMQRKAERRRAFRTGKKSGGPSRCSSRSGPAQTAEKGIMWARLRVEIGG